MFRPEALAPTSLPTSWGLFATGGAAGGVTFLCLAHRVLEVLTAADHGAKLTIITLKT